MADLVEPLEIPVRMMRRSSKVKWEKAFGFFIGVPTFPAAERQDKCKTKSNRDGSRNECRTKFHFTVRKIKSSRIDRRLFGQYAETVSR